MKLHLLAAALAFIPAACGQPSTAPGLTGSDRTSFVDASVASCTRAAQADASNASVPVTVITQYCTCYSNKMADSISPAEAYELNAQASDPAKLQAALQPRIIAAVQACRPTAPAQPAP